jgi:hypothetical protein
MNIEKRSLLELYRNFSRLIGQWWISKLLFQRESTLNVWVRSLAKFHYWSLFKQGCTLHITCRCVVCTICHVPEVWV